MATDVHDLSLKLITGAFPTVRIFGIPNIIFVRKAKLCYNVRQNSYKRVDFNECIVQEVVEVAD